MGVWNNSDNLRIKFGRDEASSQASSYQNNAGSYKTYGSLQETEVVLTLTDLSTSTQLILNDVLNIPKNVRIEEIEAEVVTAATSGGSATLDFGLIRSDRTTELDYDGFIAAGALSTINSAGKKVTYITGSTGAGALIGTTLSNQGLLVAKAGTAVFTAGVLRLRVRYFNV